MAGVGEGVDQRGAELQGDWNEREGGASDSALPSVGARGTLGLSWAVGFLSTHGRQVNGRVSAGRQYENVPADK